MTRTQYLEARRLLRDNGSYAYRWLAPDVARTMKRLADGIDPLAHRQWVAKMGYPMLHAEMTAAPLAWVPDHNAQW